jgi:cation:H+ antiporter
MSYRMSFWSFLWFAVGLSLTLGGALVAARGAGRLSDAAGFSPLFRALVPLAFAASLPELAVAWHGTIATIDLSELALGDGVGSVIANYFLALAVAALALPLIVSPRLLRFAFPLGIVLTLAMLGAAWTGTIVPAVGGCLVLVAVVWPIVVTALEASSKRPAKKSRKSQAKRATQETDASPARAESRRILLFDAVGCAAGAVAIYFGSRLFLSTSPKFASLTGLDETTFGLVIVALVTTSPEAVLCLLLSLRGDRQAAPGIVVGSGLFSLTAALGVAALHSPEGLPVPEVLFELALPIAIAAGLACVPTFYGLQRLSRSSGLALFAFYVAFVVYVIVDENLSPADNADDAQQSRFYAMFLLAIGLIVVLSLIAIVERLVQKARLADE